MIRLLLFIITIPFIEFNCFCCEHFGVSAKQVTLTYDSSLEVSCSADDSQLISWKLIDNNNQILNSGKGTIISNILMSTPGRYYAVFLDNHNNNLTNQSDTTEIVVLPYKIRFDTQTASFSNILISKKSINSILEIDLKIDTYKEYIYDFEDIKLTFSGVGVHLDTKLIASKQTARDTYRLTYSCEGYISYSCYISLDFTDQNGLLHTWAYEEKIK